MFVCFQTVILFNYNIGFFFIDRTHKMGCTAIVKVRLDITNSFLVIKFCDLQHSFPHSKVIIINYSDHDDDNKLQKITHVCLFSLFKEAYHTLPRVRRLPPESKQRAAEMMRMQCKRKFLQIDLFESTKKHVTLKDLRNIKYLSQLTRNSFQDVIEVLKKNGIFFFLL